MSKLTEALTEEQARTLERASAPQRALAEAVEDGRVRMTEILAALGFDPSDPRHQAGLLACDRYGLDPLLRHLVIIPGAGPYVTRDGRLHVAHRSGAFDGMTLDDTGETDTHWTATVSVYRKDMRHPFTYAGRYPKERLNRRGENIANVEYGPEMAVKCAEAAALRRAFDVCALPSLEERFDIGDDGTFTPNEASVVEVIDATIDEPERSTHRRVGDIEWDEPELPLDEAAEAPGDES